MTLRIVTFKADLVLVALLDRYARSKRMSRSEAIRYAILKLLEEEGLVRIVTRNGVQTYEVTEKGRKVLGDEVSLMIENGGSEGDYIVVLA